MDIINCGRVGYGEKFKYKYYKSYLEVECNDKLVYVDNTNYNPKEMDKLINSLKHKTAAV